MTETPTAPTVYASPFDAAALLESFDIEGRRLVRALRAADLDGAVPNCPGWTVRELATHVGWVYRWVDLIVADSRPKPPGREDRAACEDPDPQDGPGVLDRLDLAHGRLVAALANAPEGLGCWTTWAAGAPRDFWIRRMVHETLVHRVDAENAHAGLASGGEDLTAALAADGVDEMVCGFASRYSDRLRAPAPAVISLSAVDSGHSWWVRIGPGAPEFGRGDAPGRPDTRLAASAGELLLFLWNRRGYQGLDVSGDTEPLETWAREAHL